MKKLIHLFALLILGFNSSFSQIITTVFNRAQTDTNNLHAENKILFPKNQLDLNIEDGSLTIFYKRQIYKRLYVGVAVGGGAAFKIFYPHCFTFDLFNTKFFIDFYITKRFHIYEACAYNYLSLVTPDGYQTLPVLGIQTGFFYRIHKKLEIGLEPAILFYPHTPDWIQGVSVPAFITFRIPLAKWPK